MMNGLVSLMLPWADRYFIREHGRKIAADQAGVILASASYNSAKLTFYITEAKTSGYFGKTITRGPVTVARLVPLTLAYKSHHCDRDITAISYHVISSSGDISPVTWSMSLRGGYKVRALERISDSFTVFITSLNAA